MAHKITPIEATEKPWHGMVEESKMIRFIRFSMVQPFCSNTFSNAKQENFNEISDDILALK